MTLFQVCLIFFACWHYVGMGGGIVLCCCCCCCCLFVCFFVFVLHACFTVCLLQLGVGREHLYFLHYFSPFCCCHCCGCFVFVWIWGHFFVCFWKWSWIVLRLCLLVSVAVGLLKDYSSLKTLNHFFFLTWLIYAALMEYSLLYNLLTGQQDFFDNVISLCFFVVHGLQDFQL